LEGLLGAFLGALLECLYIYWLISGGIDWIIGLRLS
jgi:hypothetical protein